ncbi:helix-turn-helix domain-containing protein [Ectothiorhodospira haloalkaliphila]|uniref:helix-turn-helix domain-containing protein n=1 Tax=Ectothiorhodospira haloalkaliphila TaxID=421628 RepID=UPI001EE9047F|nr:helix-turn-helix domain-containing protein [Ectothiorhodospira haloalkaliphila]MCG5525888.1 helix-turn-helix domain-containing protein [Ectothiorhodospira haloalkaliphila]
MAKKRYDKGALFNDYLLTLWRGMEHIESVFGVKGLLDQVFGVEAPKGGAGELHDLSQITPTAMAHVEKSCAWVNMSELYDYAVEGLLVDGRQAEELVLYGQEILLALSTEGSSPCQEWTDIVSMGDARFGLHDGASISPEKIALLANVDLRTVRNAISAGELNAEKIMGVMLVDHESAIRWLHGRRGFKPTRIINMQDVDLQEIDSALALATLLKERRQKLALDEHRDILPSAHPAVNDQILNDLEEGLFALPLDAAFPLADFYRLERTDFLRALMRCFYPEQYKALASNA